MLGKLPGENILLEEEGMRGLDRNTLLAGERIIESGLFDSEFYIDTYGENLAEEGSPIEHFLEVGLGGGIYLSVTSPV